MAKEDWPDWQIFVDYGCVCVYCGFDGTANPLAWLQLVVDHLIPKGSSDDALNKVVACCKCNSVKGGRWDKAFDGSVPLTVETKPQLVESAKQAVQEYRRRWERDFEPMMAEIRARKAKAAPTN